VNLNAEECLIDYYDDLKILYLDCEKTEAARLCPETCDVVCRVLLYQYAVSVRNDGSPAHPV
jgi:hypothetical protein